MDTKKEPARVKRMSGEESQETWMHDNDGKQ